MYGRASTRSAAVRRASPSRSDAELMTSSDSRRCTRIPDRSRGPPMCPSQHPGRTQSPHRVDRDVRAAPPHRAPPPLLRRTRRCRHNSPRPGQLKRDPRGTEFAHDPTPVRVLTVERALYEQRVSDLARPRWASTSLAAPMTFTWTTFVAPSTSVAI